MIAAPGGASQRGSVAQSGGTQRAERAAMITPIPGWSWEEGDDPSTVTLRPQGQPEAGTIRYVERVRPLRSPSEIARSLPLPPGAFIRRVSEPETFVTAEGEYGAIVIVAIAQDTRLVHRAVAMVQGDDFYALLVGQTAHPELAEPFTRQVMDLARRDTHMLGVRRRRFRFDAPAGWDGFVAGLFHAHYHPPDFPRDPSSILVYPALPLEMVARTRRDMPGMMVGNAHQEEHEVTIQTNMGLCGAWFRLRQNHSALECLDVVLLEDQRYLYPAVLRAPATRRGEHRKRLQQLVQSIEPIPLPASWFKPAIHAGHHVVQWLN